MICRGQIRRDDRHRDRWPRGDVEQDLGQAGDCNWCCDLCGAPAMGGQVTADTILCAYHTQRAVEQSQEVAN